VLWPQTLPVFSDAGVLGCQYSLMAGRAGLPVFSDMLARRAGLPVFSVDMQVCQIDEG
jgi:hypothetical protein